MHLLLSWRIIVLLKKGHFYTISHSPKSFHMYNPTCSSQRPFEPASSLWPLWMEEGGPSKRNHLTKATQIGGAALGCQNRALASGSVMSACVWGRGGKLGKMRNSGLMLWNHYVTIWEFGLDSLPSLRPGTTISHSNSPGRASKHPLSHIKKNKANKQA